MTIKNIHIEEVIGIKQLLKLMENHDDLTLFKNGIPLYNINKINNAVDLSELNYLLSKVGRRLFVEYYQIFQKRDDAYRYLPIKYSKSSRNLRSIAAKKIIMNGWGIEALKSIVMSRRIDHNTISLAKAQLSKLGIKPDEIDYKFTMSVKNLIPLLLLHGLLIDHMENLLDRDYCHKTFGLQFSLFQQIDMYYDEMNKRTDSKNHIRYYKAPIEYRKTKYLLCSHWNENRHKNRFNIWIVSLLFNDYKLQKTKVGIREFYSQYWDFLDEDVKTILLNT